MTDHDDLVWEGQRRTRSRGRSGPRIARGVVVFAALGLLGVLGLVLSAPGERGEVMGLPRELGGRWGTDHPRYSDRRLIIEPEGVDLIIDTGEEGRARYPIIEVRGWTEDGRRGYRIYHETPAGEQVMELFVEQDGTLRLKNPPEVVWRRVR